jgi:hypothetical protein
VKAVESEPREALFAMLLRYFLPNYILKIMFRFHKNEEIDVNFVQ